MVVIEVQVLKRLRTYQSDASGPETYWRASGNTFLGT